MNRAFTNALCMALAIFVSGAATAAVPLLWEVKPGQASPVAFDRFHGESLQLSAEFVGFSEPPFAPGADVRLWYQTNGMGSAWWSAPASIDSNMVSAVWSPELDPGAERVNLFFGAPSNAYCSAVLRLRGSPGFAPNALPLPVSSIDFADVLPLNAPWLLPAATNATLAAADSYADSAASLAARAATNHTAAAATAATNYTDAATTLKTRGLSSWQVTASPPDVSVPAPYWGDGTDYPDFPETTPDNPNGAWIVDGGQFGKSVASSSYTATLLSWTYAYATVGPTAEADVTATRARPAGYILGTQSNKVVAAQADLSALSGYVATNYYTIAETDDAINALAAYYITATAQGAAFATYAALTNATVYYSGGAVRVPTRNDYCVVLADETHGGAEWRYIYAVADGATSGQWEAQYPIETNDYEALSNKPQINGNALAGNKSSADLGLASAASAVLNQRTELGPWVTIPAEFYDNGEGPFESAIPYWMDDGEMGPGWYVYNEGTGATDFLDDDPDATRLYWTASMVELHEFTATRTPVQLPGYVLGSQTGKPLASEAEAEALRQGKQDTLSFDTTPTAGSSNPVTSGGIKTALDDKLSLTRGGTVTGDLTVGEIVSGSGGTVKLGYEAGGALIEVADYLGDTWTYGYGFLRTRSSYLISIPNRAGTLALSSDLRYSWTTATVPAGATPTVTGLADRAINAVTLGASVTVATNVLPQATASRARDFFIDMTIQSSDAPTIVFIDPASGTSVAVKYGAADLAGITPGNNLVLFTEIAPTNFRVSVRHEDFPQ